MPDIEICTDHCAQRRTGLRPKIASGKARTVFQSTDELLRSRGFFLPRRY